MPVWAALMIALGFGIVIEAQSSSDAPPYPPPGRLVDVGGWRLHLNCTGRATSSQPIVILEAGIGDFSGSRAKLPPDAQRMRTWALGRWQHAAAAVNPFESDELAALRADRAKKEYPLGDLPLIVLTRGISDETGPDGKSLEDEHQKEQETLATLALNGKQVIATHSGHDIQLDEPDLVTKAIGDVLNATRR